MVDYAHSLGQTNSTYYTQRIHHEKQSYSSYKRFGKRLFDIAFTLAILPLISFVILFLWWVVRKDGGTGFFGHTRIGQNGRKFRCWKLRTMAPNAEDMLQDYLAQNPEAAKEWERDQKLQNDPRITRIGNVLRQTSLDELPQFWNVLSGDMSLVGPRPIVAAELDKYGADKSGYLAMKPGLTGLWQVSGRNDVTYEERVALDMEYGARMTFALDLLIVIRTAITVLRRTGQ